MDLTRSSQPIGIDAVLPGVAEVLEFQGMPATVSPEARIEQMARDAIERIHRKGD